MSRSPAKAGPPPKRWMVAAWPGMGNVAVISAGYLIQKLKMRPVAELGTPGLFDVRDVDVSQGVIAPPRQPRNLVFRLEQPLPTLDLTVFLGEAQPDHGAFALAQGLLEHAEEYKVERLITFASMSTQLHPSQQPRVFGAATTKALIEEIERAEVHVMKDGQIGGLNGVALGAAAQRGVEGICLLGEIPFFAAGVGNPKASKAVLDAFCLLSKIELDFEELAKHVETTEAALLKMLAQLEEEAVDDEEAPTEATPQPGVGEPGPKADHPARPRIEQMFEEARRDRTKAMPLKQELDRLGLFGEYEDRFLDLFRRAE